MTVSMAAIRTVGLEKRYREVCAVDGLDLEVRAGEIYGFLGRNGAGKTTTIRMLLGLARPTRGQAFLFGKDVASDRSAAVSMAGSLVETATAYPTLTVRENLEIHCRLTRSTVETREASIRMLGLEDLAERRAGRLSLGNKQRLALARALLPSPRLLILDEPANGLDPAGIAEIRRLLRRLCDESGVTVFVSSHILAEVAQLADRIGIIHRGRLVEETTPREWVGEATHVVVRTADPDRARALIQRLDGARDVRLKEDGALEVWGVVASSAVARVLVEAGLPLNALVPVTEDLETRFLRLTGGEP